LSTLHVATRKGLFAFDPDSGDQAMPPAFLGEPVSAVLSDGRTGQLYAALALGHFGAKLHRSADGGRTWTEIAVPAYPAAAGEKAPSLAQIWTLAAGGPDQPGRLWAGTIPGGLFRSDDDGASWALVESLWQRPERARWFGGGYDHPGIHSILLDPRCSRRLVVGVSCGGVWSTRDDGESWELGGLGLHGAYMPPESAGDPEIQDPHRIAASGAAPDTIWCQHHCGIFRSDDGGRRFAAIAPDPPSGFGFAVAVHPADPDTAWFVPAMKDETRIPADGRFVVTRTRDGGRSFESLDRGLPPPPAWDLVYRHGLAVDRSGERLAMGSTTGGLWLGRDGGAVWQPIGGRLPPIYEVAFG
jgi:hypothetical protein